MGTVESTTVHGLKALAEFRIVDINFIRTCVLPSAGREVCARPPGQPEAAPNPMPSLLAVAPTEDRKALQDQLLGTPEPPSAPRQPGARVRIDPFGDVDGGLRRDPSHGGTDRDQCPAQLFAGVLSPLLILVTGRNQNNVRKRQRKL